MLFLSVFISSAQQTFTATDTPLPITDNNTTESTIDVAGVGVLGPGGNEIEEVALNITHTFDGDLDITLVAPDGVTTLNLNSDNGGSGDDYIDTRFQNGGADITAGASPFDFVTYGAFQPEGGDFSTFDGINADGNWTLQVFDDANSDVGTLNSWEITFSNPPPPNDNAIQAIPLIPGINFAENALYGSNAGATASETADPSIPAPGCADYQGGDLWFSVAVPADGNVNIETNPDNGSPLTDTGIAVYSGAVGAFNLIACDDNNSAEGNFSRINITERVPGETLYIRVWEAGNDAFGSFRISAWNTSIAVFNTDNQDLIFVADTISLSRDPDDTRIDLTPYLDNTDSQDLIFAGDIINLSGDPDGTQIDLTPYLDNTDSQDLIFAGDIISLSGDPDGTQIDLTPYLDNTDSQDLIFAGDIISLSGDPDGTPDRPYALPGQYRQPGSDICRGYHQSERRSRRHPYRPYALSGQYR